MELELRRMRFDRLVVLVILCFTGLVASAQLEQVLLYGNVKDMSNGKKLDGVTIYIYKNGAKLTDAHTNASGKYELSLDYGADYKLEWTKPGYIGKNIMIDTRNVPEEDRIVGHGMNIEMTLMVEVQGVDYSVLKEAFGKAKFGKTTGSFEWDMEYTTRMRDAQARLMKDYEERKKRELTAEADYAKQMQAGEAAMKALDYGKAVLAFTAALDAKPKDPVASAKLSDAKMQQESREGDKKLEEQYATLIKEADVLFSKKSYAEAKTKYTTASEIKDKEVHPKQRIREIDVLLADMARKEEEERKAKELQQKYSLAITTADAAFKSGKWDEASAKYTEASGLKPDEKYPKDQLVLIIAKKEEAARKAEEERLAKELQQKYQAAIVAADAAFKGEKWDDASAKYTEANGLKPEEKYPKEQLALVAKRKDEAAKKAEEERLAKELQQKYLAALAAADASFKGEKWDDAAARYTEASGLKPEEKYPKDQLAAILLKKDDLARKAEDERKAKELDEQYRALIAAGDIAFRSENLDEASSKYNEALGLKAGEKYPKDQLNAIQKKRDELAKKLEDERKQKELDERYQTVLAAGDKAFGKEDWELARGKYTEASAIKPTEKYPKDQLAAITKNIADAEIRRKEEELNVRYESIIGSADVLFDREDLAGAKAKYQEALALKPQERYPKERIAEADSKIAEKARIAEEERKQKELDARYAEMIAKADKAYNSEQWSAALNEYKDALKLKPLESHPKSRISAIELKLDAAAQAKAEEERLAREKQELDKRYAELIALADRSFGSKDYTKADRGYRDALSLKPGEAHPTGRLSEIERILSEERSKAEAEREAADRESAERARKAEEARLAAELEAAERARKAEAERLAAQAAAAEKARLEEEDRMRKSSVAEQEARYRELVSEGDKAFDTKDFLRAKDRFNSALGMKPEEKYPKERLAAIDAAIEKDRIDRANTEASSAEKRRLEEERRRKEQEAAEAARLAALSARQQDDEARRIREAEEAEARRLADERARMEREGSKVVEERYRSTLVSADEALALKNYPGARSLYAQASDIKPTETYPKAKIDQIDRLLEEQERQRLEAEMAALRAAQARKDDKPRQSTTIDIRKEQEAEQFMRAAREREEAEKNERIKKLKAEVERQEAENALAAEQRRLQGVVEKEGHEQSAARLFEGDESRRLQNAGELDAYRDALARAELERIERAAGARERSYEEKLNIQDKVAEQYKAAEDRQAERANSMVEFTGSVQSSEAAMARAGREQNERNREELGELAQHGVSMEDRGKALAEEKRRMVEDEKRAQQAQEQRLVTQSQEARILTKERLDSNPVDQPRNYSDHKRSKLAQDYPPGVTEESYTEGNKVIIRRVVVQGHRADEYSKVIAKWGTFYFKNGQSITEAIWSRETEG